MTTLPRSTALAAAVLLCAAAARAESGPPLHVVTEHRLLDANDQPAIGEHKVKFTIYDVSNPQSGNPGNDLWHETYDVTVGAGGTFRVILGDTDGGKAALGPAVFSGSARWLAIAIDGGAELQPRLRVGSVPWALVAGDSQTLGGHPPADFAPAAGATSITTVGTISAGTWKGTPVDDAYVASAAKWNAKLDAVTADAPLQVDAGAHLSIAKADAAHDGYVAHQDFARFDALTGAITPGTGGSVAVRGAVTLGSDLDVGGHASAGTVTTTGDASIGGALAAGNTSVVGTLAATSNATIGGGLTLAGPAALKGGAAITGALSTTSDATIGGGLAVSGAATMGSLSASRLTTSSDAAIGGDLTVSGSTTLKGLSFASGGSLTAPTVATAPTSCIPGQIFYVASTGTFYGCGASGPLVLAAPTGLGDSATNPGASCAAIHTARPAAGDGTYWINANGTTSPFPAVCDMTTDGGGWTRVRTLKIPTNAGGWTSVSQVPFTNPLPATPPHARVMATMQLDASNAWASWDSTAAPDQWELQFGSPMQIAGLPNGHYGINTPTATVPAKLYFNSWANCYTTGSASGGKFDIVNNVATGVNCYGQYGFAASPTQIVFSYSHWASAPDPDDVGIGSRTTAHPDWTFAYNALSYSSRTLQWWVR